MAQWGETGNSSANSVKWGAQYFNFGSGPTAMGANNTALFENNTPEAFARPSGNIHEIVGQWGVSTIQKANTTGEGNKPQHAGWNTRRVLEGGIIGATISAAGSSFANGETITISNGVVNATAVVTSNSAGNLVAVGITSPGRWASANGSLAVSTFNREKHLLTITVSTAGGGYVNGDLVIAGNGISIGTGTITTNGTANVTAVTIVNPGLWGNAVANTVVTFTVQSANASATGATFTANLTTSTGGTIAPVFSDRVGRVQYETLVAMGSLTPANNAILPGGTN